MKFIIVTGMSGAGKSQAVHCLEDIGFFCIDNMPPQLIGKFAELYSNAEKIKGIAVVCDIRSGELFESFSSTLDELTEAGYDYEILFLDADNETLIKRYKETRRIHPLVPIKNLGMKDAIELERKMLKPIKKYSDYVIDTTHLSVRQFRDKIFAINSNGNKKELMLTCMSFGFKHGIVTDADLVFDVRCFPNPFYITELKDKTGLEQDVKDYVFSNGEVTTFLKKLYDMLNYLVPLYAKEGKSQLTIAIGCTGGKHRSVAITEEVGKYLSSSFKTVIVHRDIGKLYDSIKQEY